MNELCTKRAPHIFYVSSGVSYIVQGCCNSWTCPRCGTIRAKQEYHKMVYGATTLQERGNTLFFLTLTCRGMELPLAVAEEQYYKWSTRLLNACRNELRRRGGYWAYCQVTERQKRLHPHSHLITTYLPKDFEVKTRVNKKGFSVEYISSDWLTKRMKSAGLGHYWDMTEIRSAKGVASYVAKYLFKSAIYTKWPKGWRRIRYSRSWPRKPVEQCDEGFPLLNKVDWKRVKDKQVRIHTSSIIVYNDAKSNYIRNIVLENVPKLTN